MNLKEIYEFLFCYVSQEQMIVSQSEYVVPSNDTILNTQ